MRLFLLLLLSVPGFAADLDGVYRLIHNPEPGIQEIGSCVGVPLEDARAHFLTVAHCVGQNLRIERDGRTYQCEVVARYAAKPEPICLIRTVGAARLKVYDAGTREPEPGETVYVVGYPEGQPRGWRTNIDSVGPEAIRTRGKLISGTSGGAILNRAGELVGLAYGTTADQGVCVNLVPTLQRISKQEPVQRVQWQCQGNWCRPSYCLPSAPVVRLPSMKPAPKRVVDLSGVEGRLTALETALGKLQYVTPSELQAEANIMAVELQKLSQENNELRERLEKLETRGVSVILKQNGKQVDTASFPPDPETGEPTIILHVESLEVSK